MSIIVPLDDHPAFRRRRLARQARRLASDCRDMDATLAEMRDALVAFDESLEAARHGLAPTREDSRRTLHVLETGDIGAMVTLRDEILRRLAAED